MSSFATKTVTHRLTPRLSVQHQYVCSHRITDQTVPNQYVCNHSIRQTKQYHISMSAAKTSDRPNSTTSVCLQPRHQTDQTVPHQYVCSHSIRQTKQYISMSAATTSHRPNIFSEALHCAEVTINAGTWNLFGCAD